MTIINAEYHLAWRLVAIHTFLVTVCFGLAFIPSDNPDASIAFTLMVFVGYILDFPIGMIFEKIIRPMKTDNFPLWVVCHFHGLPSSAECTGSA